MTMDLSDSWQAGLLLNYTRSVYDLAPESRSSVFGLIDYALQLNSRFSGSEQDFFETKKGGIAFTYLLEKSDNRFVLKLLSSANQRSAAEINDMISKYR